MISDPFHPRGRWSFDHSSALDIIFAWSLELLPAFAFATREPPSSERRYPFTPLPLGGVASFV